MDDVPREKRLLPAAIDYRAEHNPNRIWGYFAKNETDVEQGFTSVTYRMLARAVDAMAWWLDEALGPAEPGFPTVAYIGVEDLRYALLLYACIKTRRRLLISFPANTETGLVNLLAAAKCTVVAASKEFLDAWDKAVQSITTLYRVEVPPLRLFMDQDSVEHYPYARTLDNGIDDQVLVLQTSGTTGHPQPIVDSNRAFENERRLAKQALLSPPDLRIATWNTLCNSHQPIFIPLSWSATLMTVAVRSITMGVVPTLMPALWKQPCSPDRIYQTLPLLPRGRLNGIFFIPHVLRDFIRVPERLEALKRFDNIAFGGAGLDRPTGDTIWNKIGVPVHSAMGSTDSSTYPLLQHDPTLWYMHRLHPDCEGYHFEHYFEDLFELCITKQPNDTRHCFVTDPHRTVFHTRDLFKTVPGHQNLYTNAGRVDDFVKLSTLTKFNGTELEQLVDAHPDIEGSLVGGDERPRPFIILQLSPALEQGRSKEEILNHLWPVFDQVNRNVHRDAQFTKELMLITDVRRPLKRTAKASLDRRTTVKMYEEEIDQLYKQVKDAT